MYQEIKKLLIDYYSNIENEAVIPPPLISTIIETLIQKGISKIVQVSFFENAYVDKTVYSTLSKYSNRCEIERFYAVQYLKQVHDKKCEFMLSQDKRNKINSYAIALSKAQSEKLPDFFEFILFDNQIAIINQSIYVCENILTEDLNVITKCKEWLEFFNSQKETIYSTDFLQEPLMQSADMMYEVASLCCSHDHINDKSCLWYHSVWQYFRLLDIVSTPSWHHDFYVNQLFENSKSGESPSVLISGTADYSMLAYVLHTANKRKVNPGITIIDLCETPLFVCRWYAKKLNKSINTLKTNIFELDSNYKYDMICADAFLTRFKGKQFIDVLNLWYNHLNNGGIAVTTIRVHDENYPCPTVPSEADVQKFKQKAIQRMEVWERHINLTSEEMGEKAEAYARTMVSNYLGTRDYILSTFVGCGFTIKYIEDATVSGELYPSHYLRVVLQR